MSFPANQLNSSFQLKANMFGILTLQHNQTPVPLPPSTKAQNLLAYLLYYRQRPHSRELLVNMFWPTLDEERARRALSQALWHIRRILPDHKMLETDTNTVYIPPQPALWVDVTEFEQLTTPYLNNDYISNKTTADLRQAVKLYCGPLLQGVYDDWVHQEKRRLEAIYHQVLIKLIDLEKQAGHYERALKMALILVENDPLSEKAHREVMRLYIALNQPGAALKQYQRCCQILDEELGIDPEQSTTALAYEIGKQNQLANTQHQSPHVPLKMKDNRISFLSQDEKVSLPLIGRQAERQQLMAYISSMFDGSGGMILVEGEAGVGKTRLLEEVSKDAQWHGAHILWGRGQEVNSNSPFNVLIELLSSGLTPLLVKQLTQIVPNLWLQILSQLLPRMKLWLPDSEAVLAMDIIHEQERLQEALVQILIGWSKITPLVLIIEDLHWVDQDTLNLLPYLTRRLKQEHVLIIGTYREAEARMKLATWTGLKNLDLLGLRLRLNLKPLDPKKTGELMRWSLGLSKAAPHFEEWLYKETKGNPLFILEILQALHNEGLLQQNEHGEWYTPFDETTTNYAELPSLGKVEKVIAQRLALLAPEQKEVLQVAAVMGNRVELDLLGEIGQIESEELVNTPNQLVQWRFLEENMDAYTFSHDKVREVVYQTMSPEDRLRLHRQIAYVLEAKERNRIEALAYHYTRAGEWAKAVTYLVKAAKAAQSVHAYQTTLEHCSQALKLLEAYTPFNPQQTAFTRFDLLLIREDIYNLQGNRDLQKKDLTNLKLIGKEINDIQKQIDVVLREGAYAVLVGDHTTAITVANQAIHLATQTQGINQEAEAHLILGKISIIQGNYTQAQQELEPILSTKDISPQLQADGLRVMGVAFRDQNNLQKAISCYQKAAQIAQTIGYRRSEGQAYNNLGVAFWGQRHLTKAKDYYEKALHIFHEIGYKRGEAYTLNNLGLIAIEFGDYTQAKSYCEQALYITADIKNRQGEAMVLGNLGRVLYYLENNIQAQKVCQQGITICQELGMQSSEGYIRTQMGHILAKLGDLDKATEMYQNAIALRHKLNQQSLVIESMAGLAQVALMQQNLPLALNNIEQILLDLKENPFDLIDDPGQIYLTCYQVLQIAQNPQAEEILQQAHTFLHNQAAKISDETRREAFLQNVKTHREILAIYQAQQTADLLTEITVQLPSVDAPLRGPISPEQFVLVKWTINILADKEIRSKKTRRHHRLLRLIQQAIEQGAVPTIENLALALQVTKRTINSDIATLRKAGTEIITRGSR